MTLSLRERNLAARKLKRQASNRKKLQQMRAEKKELLRRLSKLGLLELREIVKQKCR